MIKIVDLGIGNLQSVAHAFGRIGAETSIVSTPGALRDATLVVLPGVGAFEGAISRLEIGGFSSALRRHALDAGRPLLGICLGMQLLASRSHEHGLWDGLGLVPADVVRLEPHPPEERVPNIGWSTVRASKSSVLFPPHVDGQSFYHVHSYHLVCDESVDVAATIDFGGKRIVTAVERRNVFGVQFHPEKSQDAGLELLASLLCHLHLDRVA